MKQFTTLLFTATLFFFTSCLNGKTNGEKTNFSATEFADKIKEIPNALIIDVRTPDEYSKGHLVNAQNVDWNGNDFARNYRKYESQICWNDETTI